MKRKTGRTSAGRKKTKKTQGSLKGPKGKVFRPLPPVGASASTKGRGRPDAPQEEESPRRHFQQNNRQKNRKTRSKPTERPTGKPGRRENRPLGQETLLLSGWTSVSFSPRFLFLANTQIISGLTQRVRCTNLELERNNLY